MSVEAICGNCFWHRHPEGADKCQKTKTHDTCRKFADKQIPRTCMNCCKRGTDKCDYEEVDPMDVCMKWESLSEVQKALTDDQLLTPADVKKLIASGKDPLEIMKLIGFELSEDDFSPSVDDNEFKVLRYNLNVLYKILPSAAIKARMEPTQYNISAVTALMGEIRNVQSDIHERQDPREMFNQLEKGIISPLIQAFLEILTENINGMNKELEDHLQDNQKGRVRMLLQNTIRQFGPKLEDAKTKTRKDLMKILDVDFEEEEKK